MKRVSIIVGCLAALFALAIPAVASATKPGLELTEGESKTPATSAFAGSYFDGCFIRDSGAKITGNGKSKVKVTYASPEELVCGEGSIEGSIKEFQLSATGTVSGKGAVTIKENESGCAYEFKKFSGSFALPGPVAVSIEAEGKLTKASPKSCEKDVKAEGTLALANTGRTERLEAGLS